MHWADVSMFCKSDNIVHFSCNALLQEDFTGKYTAVILNVSEVSSPVFQVLRKNQAALAHGIIYEHLFSPTNSGLSNNLTWLEQGI